MNLDFEIFFVRLIASAVDLPNPKCKVHLAFRPKTCSTTGRPKLGKNG